jgi:hypothetical protein
VQVSCRRWRAAVFGDPYDFSGSGDGATTRKAVVTFNVATTSSDSSTVQEGDSTSVPRGFVFSLALKKTQLADVVGPTIP